MLNKGRIHEFNIMSVRSEAWFGVWDTDIIPQPVFSTNLVKASALWGDTFYKLICPYICLSVCLCVCPLLRYDLNVFLPQLPKVECPKILEIWNPWGKEIEKVV